MSSSSKSDITVAIVGGGLGGLCAAIALGRAGYSGTCSSSDFMSGKETSFTDLTVHLFEQAPE
jgi:thioredoxin reductase